MLKRASEGWEGTGRGREGLGMLERTGEFWRGPGRVGEGMGVLKNTRDYPSRGKRLLSRAALLWIQKKLQRSLQV